MDLAKRVPLVDQENIGEGKGRKSSQTKPGGQTERKTLRPLQPHSSGKICSSTTFPMSKHVTSWPQNKFAVRKASAVTSKSKGQVQVKNKGVQTASLDYETCASEEPPLEYWKVLAEQRRQALADTLLENEELHIENETLRKKVTELEKRLENKDYFAMMYKIACNDSAQDQ